MSSNPASTTGPRRIQIAELEQRLGVHRATIRRWQRAGAFPAPHFVGEHRAWFVGEIEAWEAHRMADLAVNRRGARNLHPTASDAA